MRNLHEYPITWEEIYEALEWAKAEAMKDEGIGNIRPAALQKAMKLLSLMENA